MAAGRRLDPCPPVAVSSHHTRRMHQPRHIYASSASRGERSWGRPRRRASQVIVRLLLAATAAGAVLLADPHLGF